MKRWNLFILAVLLLGAKPAEPPMDELLEHEDTIERVDAGISWLLRRYPHWYLSADEQGRREMAEHIVRASTEADVPAELVTVMVYRESSFRTDVKGKLGEVGLMQVYKKAKRDCDLDSALGQLRCGTRWLRLAYDQCKTWSGAVTMYACGACKSENPKTQALVRSRLVQWRRLQEELNGRCAGESRRDLALR